MSSQDPRWSRNQSSQPGSSRLQEVLVDGVNIMERTNHSLLRATQVARENEQIGSEVMGSLGYQREGLLRARERLVDTDQDLKRTHGMIKSINRRVLTNKCLLIVIIVIELLILGSLVYFKFLRKK